MLRNLNMDFIKIDENNFRDFGKLAVSLKQKTQVADNIKILARAFAYREYEPIVYGIAINEKPIGILFYRNYHKDNNSIKYLDQFMIDEKYQKMGYGTLAMNNLISILKKQNVDSLYLCYIDGNDEVLKFYEKLGFSKTGKNDENEIELILNIKD